MTMITPSYLGETIEYSSLHACRSTLEDPTSTHCSGAKWAYRPDGFRDGRQGAVRCAATSPYQSVSRREGASITTLHRLSSSTVLVRQTVCTFMRGARRW